MAYNCKDVTIMYNTTDLSSKGFISDGDFLTITPATDISDVFQDKSGNYFMVAKNNNLIGEIKFSVMQGSPLYKFLRDELDKFRLATDYPVTLKIKIPFEETVWIMDYAAFTLVPEHGVSAKTNSRDFTLKGKLYSQPLANGDELVSNTTQGITDVAQNIASGVNSALGTMGAISSAIADATSSVNQLGGLL